MIYIEVFYDGTMPYLKMYTDDVINTTNNGTEFTEIRRVFGEAFEIKSQEGSVLN